MSILVTTLFPLVLSGALPPPHPALIPPAAIPVAKPAPVVTPAITPVLVRAPVLAPVQTPVQTPVPAAPAVMAPVQAPETALVRINAPDPAPAPQTAPAAVDRDAIIARVGKALSDTKSAQGKFSQTDAWGDVSSGVFYISRPGKVRFEYTAPEPMLIVSDGVSVSIEEPKRQSWDSAPLSSTPLSLFLRSNVDLQRDGSVVEVTSRGGSHFVSLEDKTGEAEGRMILEFRASDFELLGWRTLDGSGAETRVRLTDTKTNVTLRPSLFIVQDPSDVRDNRR